MTKLYVEDNKATENSSIYSKLDLKNRIHYSYMTDVKGLVK